MNAEAVMDRVAVGPDCWMWTGVTDGQGYGRFRHSRQDCCCTDGKEPFHHKAHRVVYELLSGPIPKDKELDHLCRNRGCVNPDHLEPVSHAVNVLRGESWAGVKSRQTHCIHGHSFDATNTYIDPRGHRQCRKCNVRRVRAYKARLT